MNEIYDEYGHRTEFTPTESQVDDQEAVEALEETIEKFEAEAKKDFNRSHFEAGVSRGGQRFGHGTRAVVEFTGDSVGLLILKTSGHRALAYKVITGGRRAGQAAEVAVSKIVTGGGKLLGITAERMDVDYLRERAGEIKDDVSHKVKESDVLEKIEAEHIKAKAQDLYQNVSARVQEGREKIFKPEDPEEARLKQEELEQRIEAFEKLYEEEARERLHKEEGYQPEEFKETN